MTKAAIVIPSFNGVERVRYELDTLLRNDPDVQGTPIFVVEDPSGKPGVREGYDALEMDYPVEVHHLSEWSNMHGAAMKAFEIAFAQCDPEWVIYIGDDLAITKGSLSSLLHFVTKNDLQTVGLVQPSYWNAGDLAWATSERPDCVFFNHHDNFYKSMAWTDKVPRNPHWDGTGTEFDGYARPYVNVNGCGFAAHADTYRQVGGFAEGTWCLDESLSYRVWTGSDRGIVCLPGPPLVHYFGASTLAGPPAHDLHTEERWIEAIGHSKSECDKIMRAKMGEREAAINAEMRGADYWEPTLTTANG